MYTEIGIRRQALLVATAMLWPVVTLGAPQVPPSAPMTVVNTSNNPVPVTGSVGVTGGVTVNNPSSSPVPVSGVVVSGEVTELIHVWCVVRGDHRANEIRETCAEVNTR